MGLAGTATATASPGLSGGGQIGRCFRDFSRFLVFSEIVMAFTRKIANPGDFHHLTTIALDNQTPFLYANRKDPRERLLCRNLPATAGCGHATPLVRDPGTPVPLGPGRPFLSMGYFGPHPLDRRGLGGPGGPGPHPWRRPDPGSLHPAVLCPGHLGPIPLIRRPRGGA